MKTQIKRQEIKGAGNIIFIAIFVLIASFSAQVKVNATSAKSNGNSVSQIDQTPMYSDPKYSNQDLNTNSNVNDQNKMYAPPPQAPEDDNQIADDTPVSSSIIPLLLMAFGLALWILHTELKKEKK